MYEKLVTYQVTEAISKAACITVVCCFIDALKVALKASGIKGRTTDFSLLIAKLIYATWAFFKIRIYKRSVFAMAIDCAPKMTAPCIPIKEGVILGAFQMPNITAHDGTGTVLRHLVVKMSWMSLVSFS